MLGRRLILLLGLVVGASGFLLPHTLAPSRVSSRAASSTAIKVRADSMSESDAAHSGAISLLQKGHFPHSRCESLILCV